MDGTSRGPVVVEGVGPEDGPENWQQRRFVQLYSSSVVSNGLLRFRLSHAVMHCTIPFCLIRSSMPRSSAMRLEVDEDMRAALVAVTSFSLTLEPRSAILGEILRTGYRFRNERGLLLGG
jgi:hypothetical protein